MQYYTALAVQNKPLKNKDFCALGVGDCQAFIPNFDTTTILTNYHQWDSSIGIFL